jgi:hypothetical protein
MDFFVPQEHGTLVMPWGTRLGESPTPKYPTKSSLSLTLQGLDNADIDKQEGLVTVSDMQY